MSGSEKKRQREGRTTCFAPAGRADPRRLEAQAREAVSSPLVEALLRSFSGIVVIVNAQRQIVATNPVFFRVLGIENAEKVLGMRPGEALRCIHSARKPDGCGTTRFCSSCGAAAAIVLSQSGSDPVERECLVTATPHGYRESFEFLVRANPLRLGEGQFTVVTLLDISAEKRKIALQRIFFHDVMNILTALTGSCELLVGASPGECRELASEIQTLSDRLRSEVCAHRDLQQVEAGEYRLKRTMTSVRIVADSLDRLLRRSPVAEGRTLEWTHTPKDVAFESDLGLLLRVLTNMLTNAFEATPQGGVVKVWYETDHDTITFHVWNWRPIPRSIASQVFQRSFSTKTGPGHGLGTYAMKLFGERYLEGKVWFTSSPDQGTRFSFCIPLKLSARSQIAVNA